MRINQELSNKIQDEIYKVIDSIRELEKKKSRLNSDFVIIKLIL